MDNEACLIVGVAFDDIVETTTRQVSAQRYNDRTGEPCTKQIREFVVKIAGKVVYQDEEDLLIETVGDVEKWINSQIQQFIGRFGVIQIFREYRLVGVDVACLDQGYKATSHHLVVPLEIKDVIQATAALEQIMEKAFGDEPAPTVRAYICGVHGEDVGVPF